MLISDTKEVWSQKYLQIQFIGFHIVGKPDQYFDKVSKSLWFIKNLDDYVTDHPI